MCLFYPSSSSNITLTTHRPNSYSSSLFENLFLFLLDLVIIVIFYFNVGTFWVNSLCITQITFCLSHNSPLNSLVILLTINCTVVLQSRIFFLTIHVIHCWSPIHTIYILHIYGIHLIWMPFFMIILMLIILDSHSYSTFLYFFYENILLVAIHKTSLQKLTFWTPPLVQHRPFGRHAPPPSTDVRRVSRGNVRNATYFGRLWWMAPWSTNIHIFKYKHTLYYENLF